ncbi:MAG: mechanosensitive ion channel domain-containing protein [Kiloniellaceae bacterium]
MTLLLLVLASPNSAQEASAPVDAGTQTKIDQLLELLGDPQVRSWLDRQREAVAPVPTATGPVAAAMASPGSYLSGRLGAIRQHVRNLVAALPTLPQEVERTRATLGLEFAEHGPVRILLLIAAFVALGFSAEWLFYRAASGVEAWIVALPLATVRERLRAVAVRLAYGVGIVAAFAIGSIGAFLVVDWPPLLRQIVLAYLLAFLTLRVALTFSRFLLAPGGERFRVVPMSTESAWYWHRRIAACVGWFAFGWVTLALLDSLGMSVEPRQIVAYTLGLGLLAVGLEAVWRRPAAAPPAAAERVASRLSRRAGSWLLSVYFGALWLLWVATAMPLFWLCVFVIVLPAALRLTRRSVNHVLRPPGTPEVGGSRPELYAVCLERGARAALIIGAALLLAHAWQVDLIALTAQDTLATRLLRGALNAVVIVLFADFAWHVMKALIDRKLADSQVPGLPDSEEARRRSRLRTLLPILKNVLFAVLIVIVALMILSAMGIEIGPLIAGAGVVGVAIGFGAQTLVKDIISGVFYLLDDAFRVGEYIQSGGYKGTVESFSLRSVKLRHHRGPLYTVPFGELGAVQNMSRDWVIDKLTIGVTYDTDLEKTRKLIKQIGQELAKDPELAPHIIEPLKMQGVEQFGDFAIKVRMKMTTKPGEQFVIRRKAYAMIKKAFAEHGIQFAFPTVQVAGGEASVAAASQSLEMLHRPQVE